jgi:hypothetical protein
MMMIIIMRSEGLGAVPLPHLQIAVGSSTLLLVLHDFPLPNGRFV